MDILISIYSTGFVYIYPISVILFIAFSLYRGTLAMQHYIKTGEIDRGDHSWFFTDRWVFSPDEIQEYRQNDYFGNNPMVIILDVVLAMVIFCILTAVWPVTFTVGAVIAYARVARKQYLKKQEFIQRLAGTYEKS